MSLTGLAVRLLCRPTFMQRPQKSDVVERWADHFTHLQIERSESWTPFFVMARGQLAKIDPILPS
jgi:hypothetical protein